MWRNWRERCGSWHCVIVACCMRWSLALLLAPAPQRGPKAVDGARQCGGGWAPALQPWFCRCDAVSTTMAFAGATPRWVYYTAWSAAFTPAAVHSDTGVLRPRAHVQPRFWERRLCTKRLFAAYAHGYTTNATRRTRQRLQTASASSDRVVHTCPARRCHGSRGRTSRLHHVSSHGTVLTWRASATTVSQHGCPQPRFCSTVVHNLRAANEGLAPLAYLLAPVDARR